MNTGKRAGEPVDRVFEKPLFDTRAALELLVGVANRMVCIFAPLGLEDPLLSGLPGIIARMQRIEFLVVFVKTTPQLPSAWEELRNMSRCQLLTTSDSSGHVMVLVDTAHGLVVQTRNVENATYRFVLNNPGVRAQLFKTFLGYKRGAQTFNGAH